MAVSSYTSKRGRAADREETLSWLKADFAHAAQARLHLESLWTELWRCYLVQRKRAKDRTRSNVVSPHGGMTIRDLVPQYKKMILSTEPFVRSVARKRESRDFEKHLDTVALYWTEEAEIQHKVLTVGLKEAHIFGFHCGVVDHVEEIREIELDGPELEAARANGIVAEDDNLYREILYSGPEVIPVAIEDAFLDPSAKDFYEQNIVFVRSFKLLSQLEADPRYDQDAIAKIPEMQGSMNALQVSLDDIFGINRAYMSRMPERQPEQAVRAQMGKDDPVVEILQAFTGGHLFTLANRALIIRDDDLDHPFPLYSLIPDPIPGQIYGKSSLQDGLATLEQRDFLMNRIYESVKQSVDRVVMAVPQMVQRESLRKRHNGVIWVQDLNSSMKEMQQSPMPPEAFGLITVMDREFDRSTGLGAPIQSIGGAGAVYNETATTTLRKEDNALAPIQEGVKQIERGLAKLYRIIYDIESQYWGGQQWIRLMGVDGAEWHQIDFDSLAGPFDFRLVGSQYHLNKQTQVEAYGVLADKILAACAQQPGLADLREFFRGYLDAMGLPDRDKIIPSGPKRINPLAEQTAMGMGLPVKPMPDEDFQAHLESHQQELQRAQQAGNDEQYIRLLSEHIGDTMMLVQQQQQALEQQAMQAQMELTGEANADQPLQ